MTPEEYNQYVEAHKKKEHETLMRNLKSLGFIKWHCANPRMASELERQFGAMLVDEGSETMKRRFFIPISAFEQQNYPLDNYRRIQRSLDSDYGGG